MPGRLRHMIKTLLVHSDGGDRHMGVFTLSFAIYCCTLSFSYFQNIYGAACSLINNQQRFMHMHDICSYPTSFELSKQRRTYCLGWEPSRHDNHKTRSSYSFDCFGLKELWISIWVTRGYLFSILRLIPLFPSAERARLISQMERGLLLTSLRAAGNRQ